MGINSGFQCQVNNCKKKDFKSQKELDLHYQTKHPKSACEHCGKLVSISRMNTHSRKFHRELKPFMYKCEIEDCDKEFTSTWSLRQHTKRHSESPPEVEPKEDPPEYQLYKPK